MNNKGRAHIILLIGLILIALSLAGSGFYLFNKERAKNIAMQAQLEELETRQKATERDLEESKRKVSGLQIQLQDAQTKISNLNNDLQQEKAARQEALAKMEQLRADLEQQKTSRLDLENKFSRAQDDVKKTQEQVRAMQSEKSELESKIKDLEAKSRNVELGKIVVSPEAIAAESVPAPKGKKAKPVAKKEGKKAKPVAKKEEESAQVFSLEGKVLVVNKEYNFAVINLGSKDGLKLGNVLSLYHNNAYIGELKVEKIHDAMAAVGFVSDDIKDKISEGDKVVSAAK